MAEEIPHEIPKDHPCGVHRYFLELQNREKNTQKFSKAPFFFIYFPMAQLFTRGMSYFPKRHLIRNRVTLFALMTEPKLLAVKRPFLAKY